MSFSMMANRAMAATREMRTTAPDRLPGLRIPVKSSTRTTATKPRAIPIHLPYCERGRGLATVCTESGRPLRVRKYCTRPSAMKKAAMPKPAWKPQVPHAKLVSSGPKRAPMLTPM